MGFNRSQIDAEFEALLEQDTFGDQFDFGFADEVEVSEVTGASEETKETLDRETRKVDSSNSLQFKEKP